MSVFRFTIGLFIGAIVVYWIFRGTDWRAIISTVHNADIDQILVGFVFMICSQISRSIRWYIIVRKSFPTKFGIVYTSAQLGMLFNFLIPARLGELIRAYLLAKGSRISAAQCLGTIMIDKIFDLIMVLLALIFLSLFILSHGELRIPAFLTGTQSPVVISNAVVNYVIVLIWVVLTVTITLMALACAKAPALNIFLNRVLSFIPDSWRKKLLNTVERIVNGLRILNSKKSLIITFFWSLLVWVFSYLAIYFMISALLGSSLMASFIVLVLVAVFIAIPIVPGVFGQYHLAVIIGLLFFYPDMPKEELRAIALIIHFFTLFTVVSLGVGALLRSRSSFLSTLFVLSNSKRA